MMKTQLFAVAGVVAAASSASAAISVDAVGAPTVDFPGYTTYTVTVTSDDGVMTSLEGVFDGPMNQINPAGNATVFQDSNNFFGFVEADVSQDSQFNFVSSDLLVGEQSESANSLSAAFTFPGDADFGTSVSLAQIVIADGILASARNSVSFTINAAVNGELQTASGVIPIPEPASLGLLAAGAGLIGLRRRR